MTDARLGYRNGSGVFTTQPTQYADGSSFSYDANPNAVRVFLDANNFCVLPPGVEELTTGQRAALSALTGTSGGVDFDDYAGVLNTVGTQIPDYITYVDDFLGDTLRAEWDENVGGTGTVALGNTSGQSNAVLSSGATDESHSTLALSIGWDVGVTMMLIETRIKLSHLTELIAEIGFSDALSEADGIAFTSHDSTPVAVAADAALFAFHNATGGDALTNWSAVTVKTSGSTQRSDTAIAATTGWVKLTVAIDSAGNAAFYINGVKVVEVSGAVNTSATLTPWLSIKTKTAAERNLTVDYVLISSTRS